MSTSELVEFSGWLIAAWSVGFTGGWLFTFFFRAVEVIQ